MSYTSLWRWGWSLVAVGGVGIAMFEWSAPAVIVIVVVVTAVIVAILSLLTGELVVRRGADGSISQMFTWAVVIASAGTGLLAMLTLAPSLALLVALLAVLTSPRFVALALRRTRTSPGPQRPATTPRASKPPAEPSTRARAVEDLPVVAPPPDQDVVVAAMSDQQLFCLWRRTFWELTSSAGVDDRLAVIALRQACLEELERRDPDGLSAWLDSGGRANGGPERFWHTPKRGKEADGA